MVVELEREEEKEEEEEEEGGRAMALMRLIAVAESLATR